MIRSGVVKPDQHDPVIGLVARPLPAALPLFATGLGALALLGWRRKRTARSVRAVVALGYAAGAALTVFFSSHATNRRERHTIEVDTQSGNLRDEYLLADRLAALLVGLSPARPAINRMRKNLPTYMRLSRGARCPVETALFQPLNDPKIAHNVA
jgi:hypothetical protein